MFSTLIRNSIAKVLARTAADPYFDRIEDRIEVGSKDGANTGVELAMYKEIGELEVHVDAHAFRSLISVTSEGPEYISREARAMKLKDSGFTGCKLSNLVGIHFKVGNTDMQQWAVLGDKTEVFGAMTKKRAHESIQECFAGDKSKIVISYSTFNTFMKGERNKALKSKNKDVLSEYIARQNQSRQEEIIMPLVTLEVAVYSACTQGTTHTVEYSNEAAYRLAKTEPTSSPRTQSKANEASHISFPYYRRKTVK
jgi:hypothetical protein